MARDGTSELQEAVYARLQGPLAYIGCQIFDHTPTDLDTYPRVEIGEIQVDDWGAKTEPGTLQTLILNVYSRYRGRKQVEDIGAVLYDQLHEQDFPVTGYDIILIRFDGSTVTLLPDGLTYEKSMRFRVMLDAE